MNLEIPTSSRTGSAKWIQIGMVMCFGLAAGILIYAVSTPNAANSQVFANSAR